MKEDAQNLRCYLQTHAAAISILVSQLQLKSLFSISAEFHEARSELHNFMHHNAKLTSQAVDKVDQQSSLIRIGLGTITTVSNAVQCVPGTLKELMKLVKALW